MNGPAEGKLFQMEGEIYRSWREKQLSNGGFPKATIIDTIGHNHEHFPHTITSDGFHANIIAAI